MCKEECEKHSFNPGHAVAYVLFQFEEGPRCGFQELPFFFSHLTDMRRPPWPFLDGSMNSGAIDYLLIGNNAAFHGRRLRASTLICSG